MENSEATPASGVQRFINRVANADLGTIVVGPNGTMVRKMDYGNVQVFGNRPDLNSGTPFTVVSNEEYFQQMQKLDPAVWNDVDKLDPSTPPANANGVENLVE